MYLRVSVNGMLTAPNLVFRYFIELHHATCACVTGQTLRFLYILIMQLIYPHLIHEPT